MSKRFVELLDLTILPIFLIIGVKVVISTIVSNILLLSEMFHTFGSSTIPEGFNTRQVNSITDTFLLLLLFFSLLGIALWHKQIQQKKQSDETIIHLSQVKGLAFLHLCFQLYFLLIIWMIAILAIAVIIIFQVCLKNDLLFVLYIAILSIFGSVYIVYNRIANDVHQKLAYAVTHLV